MTTLIKGNEIKIILGFFVLLFVASVLFFSFILLEKGSSMTDINIIESDSYSRTVALVGNLGVTQLQISDTEISLNKETSELSPEFPKAIPEQSYLVPDTGYFDRRIYFQSLAVLIPFILLSVLVRFFAVKHV
ncbi:hypothetical protein GW755_01850 [bacterium]|nr:hypothetical protein [bacterium]